MKVVRMHNGEDYADGYYDGDDYDVMIIDGCQVGLGQV
jgi:hypothetical protein